MSLIVAPPLPSLRTSWKRPSLRLPWLLCSPCFRAIELHACRFGFRACGRNGSDANSRAGKSAPAVRGRQPILISILLFALRVQKVHFLVDFSFCAMTLGALSKGEENS